MERKIGEEFVDFDTNLIVVENDEDMCILIDGWEKYCFYLDIDEDYGTDCNIHRCGECSKNKRSDKKNVVFLKQ